MYVNNILKISISQQNIHVYKNVCKGLHFTINMQIKTAAIKPQQRIHFIPYIKSEIHPTIN